MTADADIAAKMRRLRNYGSSQKYVHIESGTNSRLDTLQAAILQQKLPYLDQWNSDLQPALTYLGYQKGDFPHAEKLSTQILSLPMYPGLNSHQITEIVSAIRFHLLH